MLKTIIHALIACALGVALGLLWDSGAARAANVGVCDELRDWRYTICRMHNASEEQAVEMAKLNLSFCARTEEDYRAGGVPELFKNGRCPPLRAYIRQRWGY